MNAKLVLQDTSSLKGQSKSYQVEENQRDNNTIILPLLSACHEPGIILKHFTDESSHLILQTAFG